MDLIEKYGTLGLLYVVLATVGVFLVQKGTKLVDAVSDSTLAMRDLTAQIAALVRQHELSAAAAKEQSDRNTQTIVAALERGLEDVRDEVQRQRPHGAQGS
jgi:hypothetical protein